MKMLNQYLVQTKNISKLVKRYSIAIPIDDDLAIIHTLDSLTLDDNITFSIEYSKLTEEERLIIDEEIRGKYFTRSQE